jgi:large subunit ribosomal protein L29
VNTTELKGMEKSELLDRIKQLKEELFHFRCQLAMGRIENPMRIRGTKREVARVKTVLQQKELGGE